MGSDIVNNNKMMMRAEKASLLGGYSPKKAQKTQEAQVRRNKTGVGY